MSKEIEQSDAALAEVENNAMLSSKFKVKVTVTRVAEIEIDPEWYPVEYRNKLAIENMKTAAIAEDPEYMDYWGASEDVKFEFLD